MLARFLPAFLGLSLIGSIDVHAQTSCTAARSAHDEAVERITSYVFDSPLSSACAVSLAGGGLAIVVEELPPEARNMITSASIACGAYCLFAPDAVCGEAATVLGKYGAVIGTTNAYIENNC